MRIKNYNHPGDIYPRAMEVRAFARQFIAKIAEKPDRLVLAGAMTIRFSQLFSRFLDAPTPKNLAVLLLFREQALELQRRIDCTLIEPIPRSSLSSW